MNRSRKQHSAWILWASAALLFMGCQSNTTPSVESEHSTAPSASANTSSANTSSSFAETRFGAEDSAQQLADTIVIETAEVKRASFSVHEWGLVQYSEGGMEWATSGHHARPEPVKVKPVKVKPITRPKPIERRMKKPLIYLHPEAGFDFDTSISLTVTVNGKGSRVREVWPTPNAGPQPLHGTSYTWSGVKIMNNSGCGGGLAPGIDDPACTSLTDGGVCEAYEMSLYLGEVSNCLKMTQDGKMTPVLLYNAMRPGGGPPTRLNLQKKQDQSALENTSMNTLHKVYVRLGTKIWKVEELKAGASIKMADAVYIGSSKDSIESHIRADLRAQGLSDQEAEDFLKAWAPDVLKAPYQWKTFGFFSGVAIDEMASLRVSPVPTSITRVMAFNVEGEPTGLKK